MAGPISHIVFADKALKGFIQKDPKQFIIGTLFPDIRYLKVIEREQTHHRGITLEQVQQESDAFTAGVLFHSLVDEKREAYILKYDAYRDLPDSHLATVALKIVEDAALYARISSWDVYINYLSELLPQEFVFTITEDKLREWHTLNQKLFTYTKPIQDQDYFYALGFTEQDYMELIRLVELIQKSSVVDAYITELYENLEMILGS